MPALHVVTVTPSLPLWVLDPLLTGIERSLHDAGASRVWVSDERPRLRVMADIPDQPPGGRR